MATTAAHAGAPEDRFNETMARQWPVLLKTLKPTLEDGLKGLTTKGALYVEKVESATATLDAPAGAGRLERERIEVALPLAGGWDLHLKAKLTLRLSIFGTPLVHSAPVEARISGLRAVLRARLDWSDPERPKVVSSGARVKFHLDLRSRDPLFGFFGRAVTRLFEGALHGPILALLSAEITRQMGPLLAGKPELYGTGGPDLAEADGTGMEARALEIHSAIRRDMLPYDLLLGATYSSPEPGTGTVTGHHGHGDSAIWTGHYLMAEAWRYRATRDHRALEGALVALAGIDRLFEVTGGEGLLARHAAPADSPDGRALLERGGLIHKAIIDGVPWVGWGKNFISRDQHVGVLAGMGLAWLAFDDPHAKALVKRNVTRVMGYLLKNEWIAYTPGETMSSTFIGRFEQQLAFMALAARVDPERFEAAFLHLAPQAKLIWFPLWAETFDPHSSYFKFNLDHTSLALAAALDTDPDRWREYKRGARVLAGAIGHHQNAWFDAVNLIVDPALAPTLVPKIHRELALWLTRPARAVSLDPEALGKIPTRTLVRTRTDHARDESGGGGGGKIESEKEEVKLALYPVPIPLRSPTDFLWQRSPFGVGVGKDPHARDPGVDLILPYWVNRHFGGPK